ncbi:vacuolar calcium ion transporter [Aspergillus udagawae]|uniref:Vacuolar calcium ion transporter n=1 Tax=Aspergillus udagawae TaxID=91492 RepID=A0ABQ1BDX4_9EURO|nr:vacuolar calcium ion transporter [Aspergillus udagawae]GFF99513.1 vacuolar calcium ion transporter [Aspergillus udagawae]
MSRSSETDQSNLPSPDSLDGEPRQPLMRQKSWHSYHRVTSQICHSYLSALLLLVPIGIVAGILGWADDAVFLLNLAAIVPLVSWMTLSISELSASVTPLIDELFKATLGNAVELTVGVAALARDQVRTAQSALLGSILCYLLLVLGSCFFVSGYNKKKLDFDRTLTGILSSLLMAAAVCLMVPTGLKMFLAPDVFARVDITRVTHGTAIVLFLLLSVFLLFRLRTHTSYFKAIRTGGSTQSPQIAAVRSWRPAIILAASIPSVALCGFFMVSSLSGFAKSTRISQHFISLVIIPLVGNSAKILSIVTVDREDRGASGITAVIINALRIALLVVPCVAFLGWILDVPTVLVFDAFDTVIFLVCVMVTTSMAHRGETNYFEGLMLVGTYLIVVLAFYLRPETPENILFL